MTILHTITRRAARFWQRTEGNASIEAMIFVPLMLSTLAATFAFFDAFRYKSQNVKAAFTISDALSRETDPIDDAYLDGMLRTLEYLTRSEADYSMRVTLVRWNADGGAYHVDWSQTRGTFESLADHDLPAMKERLPTLLHNERVIVVETATDYEPPFAVPGLNSGELFYNMAFTRPRFAPKLVWAES